jgi:hypothetical protein
VLEAFWWGLTQRFLTLRAGASKKFMPIVPKFRCRVCTVYGAAYEEKKQEFLDELQVCLTKNKEPLLIGGDFNLVRSKKTKTIG